jgi:putative ubiquitin-RnfH superfamily antitoxin RatB of RatAB toxin-antitoxin module
MASEATLILGDALDVTVVYSPGPRRIEQCHLSMKSGARVAEAIAKSQLLEGLPAEVVDALCVSVWGQKAGIHESLRDGDRIEILRNLRVDPKVARRERFAKQGAKSAGLFAQRRVGGKAGY